MLSRIGARSSSDQGKLGTEGPKKARVRIEAPKDENYEHTVSEGTKVVTKYTKDWVDIVEEDELNRYEMEQQLE